MLLYISDKDFDAVYSYGEEVPGGYEGSIRPEVIHGLGKSIGLAFPLFALALPRTTEAMEKYWPVPVLAIETPLDMTFSYLISESSQGNLLLELLPPYTYINEKLFIDAHCMLPLRWRELYRFFDSFSISRSGRSESRRNTPFGFSSRLGVVEYCEAINVGKIKGREFRKKLGSLCVRCWMWTDAGDALFIDEAKNDLKVYHIRNSEFDDFHVLENPEDVLDRYLAHYISGGHPKDFDFRASV